MNKWADYLISAVRYSDRQKGYITYAKVHPDEEKRVGKGFTWSRDELISALHSGKSLMTIYKKDTGDWIKGAVIKLIIKNNEHLISDNEKSDSDQLSGLQKL